jgi:hypothetical protein
MIKSWLQGISVWFSNGPRILAIAISGICILLAILHISIPSLVIDAIVVSLLAIALVPWLGAFLKSLEAFGFKVEYKEFVAIQHKADSVGILAPSSLTPKEPAYLLVADSDPVLALAGLRIEIEKRLRRIAIAKGLRAEGLALGQLLRKLPNAGLDADKVSVLNELTNLLNRAIHEGNVDKRTADWALDIGPRIIQSLETLLESIEDEHG